MPRKLSAKASLSAESNSDAQQLYVTWALVQHQFEPVCGHLNLVSYACGTQVRGDPAHSFVMKPNVHTMDWTYKCRSTITRTTRRR